MDIPAPWLWVSGAFFAMAIVTNLVMIFVLITLKNKVTEVSDEVGGLVTSLRETGDKVAKLAGRIEETTASVKDKSEKVLVSASAAVDTITGRAGLIAAVLGTAMALARARSSRKKKSAKD